MILTRVAMEIDVDVLNGVEVVVFGIDVDVRVSDCLMMVVVVGL